MNSLSIHLLENCLREESGTDSGEKNHYIDLAATQRARKLDRRLVFR